MHATAATMPAFRGTGCCPPKPPCPSLRVAGIHRRKCSLSFPLSYKPPCWVGSTQRAPTWDVVDVVAQTGACVALLYLSYAETPGLPSQQPAAPPSVIERNKTCPFHLYKVYYSVHLRAVAPSPPSYHPHAAALWSPNGKPMPMLEMYPCCCSKEAACGSAPPLQTLSGRAPATQPAALAALRIPRPPP